MAQDVKRQDFSQGPVILVKQCLIDMKIIYSYIIANKIGDENFIFKNNSFYRGLLFIKLYVKFKKKKKKKKKLKITYSRFFEIAFLPSAKDPSEEKGEKFSGFGSIEPDVTYDSHVRASVSFIFMKFKWSLFFLM